MIVIHIFFIPNLGGEGNVGTTLFYKKIKDQKRLKFAKGAVKGRDALFRAAQTTGARRNSVPLRGSLTGTLKLSLNFNNVVDKQDSVRHLHGKPVLSDVQHRENLKQRLMGRKGIITKAQNFGAKRCSKGQVQPPLNISRGCD